MYAKMISVCMATYNGARFIKQQIDSILSQLSDNDELVISDDESTDGTLEIINSYNDNRIKLFHHQKHINVGMYRMHQYATQNFENALFKAKGDYIFLSDQDDIWLPNKVKRCISFMTQFDCVVHNYQVIDTNNHLINKQSFTKNPLHNSIIANIVDNHFRGCCMAFKRDLLKIALPIPKTIIGHDYWLGTLAAHYFKVHYDTESLIQSRWYSESVSSKKRTTLWYKMKYRMDLLFNILFAIICR